MNVIYTVEYSKYVFLVWEKFRPKQLNFSRHVQAPLGIKEAKEKVVFAQREAGSCRLTIGLLCTQKIPAAPL
jgi:hypothetical protein